MLSDKERGSIRDSVAAPSGAVAERRAAISDALMVVQESRGWISDEAVAEIAEALSLTIAEVDAVATFFELVFRRKVGDHVILLCDSVSCWIMGYEAILGRLRERLGIGLGETSPDGRFTLLPAGCLGACDKGPAMMIDDELFVNLSADEVDRILEGYRDGGHDDPAHG